MILYLNKNFIIMALGFWGFGVMYCLIRIRFQLRIMSVGVGPMDGTHNKGSMYTEMTGSWYQVDG